jgi:hypothetical protein
MVTEWGVSLDFLKNKDVGSGTIKAKVRECQDILPTHLS